MKNVTKAIFAVIGTEAVLGLIFFIGLIFGYKKGSKDGYQKGITDKISYYDDDIDNESDYADISALKAIHQIDSIVNCFYQQSCIYRSCHLRV